MKPRKILVGIDEPDDVDGVLEFAAAEAVRRQCGVHLMHALSAGSRHGDGSELTLTSGTLQHAGTDVLVTGAQRLEDLLHDELSVTTELVHDSAGLRAQRGQPARLPGPAAAQARSRASTHGLRSVVNGVAGARRRTRDGGALVLAPERRARPGGGRGRRDPRLSGSLVSAALEMARQSDTDLRLVHARPDGQPSGAASGGIPIVTTSRTCWRTHPDVHVESRVEQGEPEDTLVAAGETASVVVIGRHHRRHRMGPRLGSTARAVLAQAPCPVMVVEPGDGVDSS